MNLLKLQQRAKLLRGNECIYWATSLIAHSKLHKVSVDNHRIALELRNLNTPGFMDAPPAWKAQAVWSVVHYLEDRLWATDVGWTVLTSNELIKSVRAAVSHLHNADQHVRQAALIDSINKFYTLNILNPPQ